MPPRRAWWTFLALLVLNWMLMRWLFPGDEAPTTVPYTTFRAEVLRGNVESVYSKGTSVEGRFKEPVVAPVRQPSEKMP